MSQFHGLKLLSGCLENQSGNRINEEYLVLLLAFMGACACVGVRAFCICVCETNENYISRGVFMNLSNKYDRVFFRKVVNGLSR